MLFMTQQRFYLFHCSIGGDIHVEDNNFNLTANSGGIAAPSCSCGSAWPWPFAGYKQQALL